VWKFLGRFGLLLQKMSLSSRQDWLEMLAAAWNAKKELALPDMLVRMYCRAFAASKVHTARFDDLMDYAVQGLGLSEEEVRVIVWIYKAPHQLFPTKQML
jgi:hypothetical protein